MLLIEETKYVEMLKIKRNESRARNFRILSLFFTVYLYYFCPSSFAQYNCPIWYFGQFAGLNFSSGSPVALTNGQLNTNEGCAVASTCTGSLLFYTNGVTVWDKTHTVMLNGTGLLGDPSSTQSAVILNDPSNTNQFYIFTVGALPGGGDLRYTVVDLSLNGGNGAVVLAKKNQLLLTSSNEQLTATIHNNGCDQWVIATKDNTTSIYAFLLSATGISTPIISNVGTACTASSSGQIKISPNGKLMASANFANGCKNELFNFNNQTGVFTKWMDLATNSYGIEFSSDNTKLYSGWPFLEQYNLSSGVPATINASRITIGSKGALYSMQRGPDNKIYTANFNFTCLDYVNAPNLAGVAAGYVSCGVSLAGRTVKLGLPTCANELKGNPALFNANITSACANTPITFTPSIATSCDTSGFTFHWTFSGGSPSTSDSAKATVTFSGTGSHDVKLVVSTNCKKDSLTKTAYITINSCGCSLSAETTITNSLCSSNTGSATANPINGSSPFTYSWSNTQITKTATGLMPGLYTVTITDAIGCITTSVASLFSPSPIIGQFTKGMTNCTGCGCKVWLMVNATGGTSPYTYTWSDGYVSRFKNQLCPGNFLVVVKDKNGCSINVNLTTP